MLNVKIEMIEQGAHRVATAESTRRGEATLRHQLSDLQREDPATLSIEKERKIDRRRTQFGSAMCLVVGYAVASIAAWAGGGGDNSVETGMWMTLIPLILVFIAWEKEYLLMKKILLISLILNIAL